MADQPLTGWIKISLPEDSFSHDNDYFFSYGNQGMLKVGIQCKDLETKRFITAVCNLNSEKIFVEKDFSHEQLKRNENDLLIIQEYSSKNNDEKIIEFIKMVVKLSSFLNRKRGSRI